MARAKEDNRKPVITDSRRGLWREALILLLAPVLLYVLACLWTWHPLDPGWSRSGEITSEIRNIGGLAGAFCGFLVHRIIAPARQLTEMDVSIF